MKKKVFSLMMLLLAVFGVARANELTVYEGSVTNRVVPAYVYYFDDFTRSQYVIPAEDLSRMYDGDIESITWYTSSLNIPYTSASTVDIYVKEVASASISQYVAKADCQIVYNGTLSFVTEGTGGKCVVTFNTPFHYYGGNLLIGCENLTDVEYKAIDFYGQTVSGASIGGYNASSLNNVPASQKNFIPKTTFTYSGGGAPIDRLHVKYMNGDEEVIDALDLGVRPVDAWMAPFEFTMYSDGPAYVVNVLDFTPSDGLFTVSGAELPFQVIRNNDVALNMITNGTEAGTIERQFVAITEGDRAAHIWPVTVELYAPEIPDVWEKACTQATTFPFVEVPATAHNTVLHNDYTLPFPEIEEGVDAVYKLVFTQDQMLNAEVTYGDNGKVALYRAGFEGQGGPMATNNYTGNGLASGGDTPGPGPGPQPGNNVTVILTAGDVWEDGSGYQMLLDADATAYGNEIPTSGPYTGSNYDAFEYLIPVNADCDTYTNNVVFNNSVAIQIPAGTYDWCITNPTPGTMWIASDQGNVGGRQDDYVFEAGNTYEFVVSRNDATGNDQTNVTITGGGRNMATPLPSGEAKHISMVVPLRENVSHYTAGPVIQGLPVTPGTYYLVASSTTPDFEVTINAEDMPCPMVENFDFNPQPADDADGLQPASVTLHWNIPDYATGWRLVFGSTYYPDEDNPNLPNQVSYMYPEDGSFAREMANSFTLPFALWNNTNYFWHIVFNNDCCPNGVSSPIWGFTTHLNAPSGLTVNDVTVFNDETITLNWNAVVDRTYRKYYVYCDGVRIDSTQLHNINATTSTVGPFRYNMEGYHLYVTAVYDEGESGPSNEVIVKVSGYGNVSGHVYERYPVNDQMVGIAGATVTMVGQDEFGDSHTYHFTTNGQGAYTGQTYAGSYNGSAACTGYQPVNEPVQGNPIAITYNEMNSPVDYIMDENFDGPCTVVAQYYPDSLDINSPYVKVYWGCGLPGGGGAGIIEDFETGDFSTFDWQLDGSYPWVITTNNPYEGQYCMKSTGEGVANLVSNMSVTVEIPNDGIISFYSKVNGESNWDYGHFYIDNVQQAQYTGIGNWGERHFGITAGQHTFKWSFTKDGSDLFEVGDDCFYVDYINFCGQPEPAQPGWHTYLESEFDNAYRSSVGQPSWGYEYPVSLTTLYAGFNLTKVAVFSDDQYGAVGGNFTCNVYVGGTAPAEGTLASSITVDVTPGLGAWCEYDLTTPVNISGTEPVWVIWHANSTSGYNGGYPAGCASHASQFGDWWNNGQDGWEHMGDCTWTMKNYFTNRGGRTVVLTDAKTALAAINSPVVLDSHLRTFTKGVADNTTECINPNATRVPSENTRAFSHYRVYRTNCYNDGPYTPENTVVLACELHDTIYIDVDWPDVEPGVYKWGVGCVYVGNRGEEIESPITWSAPAAINHVNGDRTGYTEKVVETLPGAHLNSNMSALRESLRGSNAYAMCLYGLNLPEGLLNFDTDNVSGAGVVGDVAVVGGGAYDATTGHIYLSDYNNGLLYEVDPATGNVLSSVETTYPLLSICTDPTTGAIYGLDNYNWLTVVDPATGVNSDVAAIDDDMVSIACNSNGQLYGLGLGTPASLYTVDKNTASSTLLGELGVNANYAQCIAFDGNTDKLYWAQCYDVSNMGFYEINVNTLTASLMVANTGELCGMVIPAAAGPGPGPGPDPTPTPGGEAVQEPRESDIVWSNCLDKDMYLGENEVSINVLLNSADSSEGVTVSFENYNELEQELYPVDDVVLDGSAFYAWETFRKGYYKVTITNEGYYSIVDSVSIWEPTELRYVMTEILYGVDNLYVSRTGWAMWEGHGQTPTPGPGPGPGPDPEPGETFTDDFETGDLSNWTLIDSDNDGENWEIGTPAEYGIGNAHSGTYCATSWSWNSYTYVPGPDNWMISPEVAGATSVSYYVATNTGYPDHYAIMASSTGTNISDFTMVFEEDAPIAKGVTGNAVKSSIAGGGHREMSPWTGRTIELPAGTKYVAFRHYNSYDMNYLFIDDITINVGRAAKADRHLEYYKVMCESIDHEPIFNTNTVNPFCQVATEGLVEGELYICKVAAVYSTGMSDYEECIWQYESCENYAGTVNGLDVNGTTVTWDYPGTPGPGPDPDPEPGETFTDDFETGSLSNWTLVDSDNDGENWEIGTPAEYGIGNAHSGTYCATSWSWNSYTYVPGPDNWMISPEVAGATSVSYYVATNTGYPDHYAIMASSTGTNISDFTMVFEEDAPIAKGVTGNAVKSSIAGGGHREMSPWTGRTIELPAGTKYVAFRHYNSYDMNYLFIDDVTITAGAKGNRDGQWYYYDNGTNYNAMGLQSGGGFYWGIMFPAGSFESGNLSKISYFDSAAHSGQVLISQGGTTAPGTQIYAQNYTTTGAESVIEINMSDPVAVDNTQNLWVVMHNTSGQYVASYDGASPGQTNGSWLSTDGAEWYESLYSATNGGYGGNWNLRAYIEDGVPGPGPGPTPNADILGAMVFLNGEWVAFVEAPTNTYTFDEEGEYCVRIVYDGTDVLPSNNFYYAMSCEECAGDTPGTCEAGDPIHAEVLGATDQVRIWWGVEPAAPINEWLYYDNGQNSDAIVLQSGGAFYWGIKFPAASLADFADCAVTKIGYFDYESETGVVRIYQGSTGNGPSTNMIGSYNFTANGTADWVEWNITPAAFDNTQDLWIVVNSAYAPMGAYTGDPNGTMLSTNGSTWYTLSDASSGQLEGTWNLRCFVTNQAKGVAEAVEMPLPQINGGELANVGVAKGGDFTPMMTRANLVKYNVYRSDDANGTYTLIGEVLEAGQSLYEYFDTPETAGTYYYQVRAEYSDGCVSEPALAADDPTHNYVSANVDAIGENSDNVALYPNPTKDNVTIEANGMSRITVVSLLGQMVFDTEVNADVYTLNMSQFNNGMYMVRIYTESGVTVKRVTVMQ